MTITFRHATKHLLYIFLFSILLGQLGKIPLGDFEGGLYLTEIVLVLLFGSWFAWKVLEESSLRFDAIDLSLIAFLVSAAISLLWAFHWTTSDAILVGLFYLLRLILYCSVFKITRDVISADPNQTVKLSSTIITYTVIFAILGLAQFALFPDFSQYVQHGWDPHYFRVLSTFFDPNYAGLILTFGIMLTLYLLYKQPRWWHVFVLGICLITLVLTFSRSSYLAFAVAIGVFSLLKDRRLIVGFMILGLLAFLLVPRVQTRVVGAFEIDETAQLRIENYNNTLDIFYDNPILGVGFNTYRAAQSTYGYFRDDRGVQQSGGHAGAGADNSLLFTLATTGIVGFSFFLLFIGVITRAMFIRAESRHLTLSIAGALLVHAQFVNSLYFPWILGWFLVTIGVYLNNNYE